MPGQSNHPAARRPRSRRLPKALTGGLAAALVLAGCGGVGHKAGGQNSGKDIADANNNGAYVEAGPITYQLQISRELNQYSTEDSQYLRGLPSGAAKLNPSQEWYGVFLWAKNQTKSPQTTTDKFVIADTVGDKYYPLKLNPELNAFAWTAQTLGADQTEPRTDTTASFGPTEGQLLLFKVNDSVYSNRPLTLYILGPDNRNEGSISLDL